MKKFFNTLFLLFGIYGAVAIIFLFFDWLLVLLFTALCVITAFVLLIFRRQKTFSWQEEFSIRHPNWTPILKVLGAYFIYIIILIFTLFVCLYFFNIDNQVFTNIQFMLVTIPQIIFVILLVGVILRRISVIIKQRR